MVDLTPVNKKLVERSKRLIRQATGCTPKEAEQAFEEAGRKPKIARANFKSPLHVNKDTKYPV